MVIVLLGSRPSGQLSLGALSRWELHVHVSYGELPSGGGGGGIVPVFQILAKRYFAAECMLNLCVTLKRNVPFIVYYIEQDLLISIHAKKKIDLMH